MQLNPLWRISIIADFRPMGYKHSCCGSLWSRQELFFLNLFQETVSTPFLIQRVFSFKSSVPGIREESHQAGNSPPPSEIRLHLRKWRRTVCAFWHIFGSPGAFQDTSTLSSEKSTVHCGRSSRNNYSSKLLRKCCTSTKFSYFHKYSGPSQGLKIRGGSQYCGRYNLPPWLRQG